MRLCVFALSSLICKVRKVLERRRPAINEHASDKAELSSSPAQTKLIPSGCNQSPVTPQGLWKVSVSPHVKSGESVAKIMWTVVACLVPPLVLSVFIFGIQTLIITAVSVASCVAVEAATQKALGRRITIGDGSTVITGMLIAFVIPPGVSPLLPVLGAVMAIAIGKHLLGGIGYNIFNPALLGRAFLMATGKVAIRKARPRSAGLKML